MSATKENKTTDSKLSLLLLECDVLSATLSCVLNNVLHPL